MREGTYVSNRLRWSRIVLSRERNPTCETVSLAYQRGFTGCELAAVLGALASYHPGLRCGFSISVVGP